jgi:rare lipoprotein A (peptidoglycan hydrolase)
VFVAPLLLLQHGSARAARVPTATKVVASNDARRGPSLFSEVLHSQLVHYDTAAGATTPPAAVAAPVTTPPVAAAASASSESGQATWYGAAPPGKCASPTLPFGTVLTVTNNATGARTTCTVDDREEAGYPRVVDLSPSGFAQLAGLSQGVVGVTISW